MNYYYYECVIETVYKYIFYKWHGHEVASRLCWSKGKSDLRNAVVFSTVLEKKLYTMSQTSYASVHSAKPISQLKFTS